VRGAYALKQEQIFTRGKGLHRVACYHHPLSRESSIALCERWRAAGADALARQPFLYALGMAALIVP